MFQAKKDQQDPTKQITQQLSQQLGELWSNVEAFKNDPQISGLFAEANNAMIDTVDPNYLFKRLQAFQAQVLLYIICLCEYALNKYKYI